MNLVSLFAQGYTPPVGPLMILLLLGVGLLLLLILKFRLQAFLALIVASIVVAVGSVIIHNYHAPADLPLSEKFSLVEVADTVVNGMGSSLGFIATIIGIGAIFGALLEHSGGTQSLANFLVRLFGKERASWAMLLTGFIVSIPVFLDVALVILAPLLYALARDTKKPLLYFGLPLCAGMAVTHAFVPPTPGPVYVASILEVNLGYVIGFGLIVGLPTALLAGPFLCSRLADATPVPLPSHEREQAQPTHSRLPTFGLVFFLIALPIGMILLNTIVEGFLTRGVPSGLDKAARDNAVAQALEGAPFHWQFIHFLGEPIVALLIATLLSVYVLGTRLGTNRSELLEITTRALGPAGIIILITGAGGVFKQVLGASGISDALRMVFADSGIPIIVLAYVFATLIRIAQGSATVAMVTAAGLMVSFVDGLSQPMLALVTVAIAAGATGFSHVNDSGFWMISRYFGMTEKQTLRTWTVVSSVISIIGFLIALVLSFFF